MIETKECDEGTIRIAIAEMEQATAWIIFTAACASRDLQQFGAWRCDYEQHASMFRKDFDDAARRLPGVKPECQPEQ